MSIKLPQLNVIRTTRREEMTSLVKDSFEEFEAAYAAPRSTQELTRLITDIRSNTLLTS